MFTQHSSSRKASVCFKAPFNYDLFQDNFQETMSLSQHDPNTCVLLYYTQHLSRSAPQYSHLPLVANNRNDFLHVYQCFLTPHS